MNSTSFFVRLPLMGFPFSGHFAHSYFDFRIQVS
ncbi:MAG: hypothetical protein ACI91Z_000254 [Yoonia sp.]|jgi:hypothetical protein